MPRVHRMYQGAHALDLTDLEGQLVDLEAGGRRGLRTQLDGFRDAQAELELSTEVDRTAAGIPPDVFEHFHMCTERLDRIKQGLVVAEKLLEVLRESHAFYVDAQQNDISIMVEAMRSRAQYRRERAILNAFEQTIRYNGQIGTKAALTKRRMAAEAATGKPAKGRPGARKKVAGKPVKAAPDPGAGIPPEIQA